MGGGGCYLAEQPPSPTHTLHSAQCTYYTLLLTDLSRDAERPLCSGGDDVSCPRPLQQYLYGATAAC